MDLTLNGFKLIRGKISFGGGANFEFKINNVTTLLLLNLLKVGRNHILCPAIANEPRKDKRSLKELNTEEPVAHWKAKVVDTDADCYHR